MKILNFLKKKLKAGMIERLRKKEFKQGDKVLLYNSRLKLFAGKLRSKWEGPYDVEEAYPSGAVKLKGQSTSSSWIVNGQRLKHYKAEEVSDVTEIKLVTAGEFIRDTYVSSYDENSFVDIFAS
jgi:hypothetical protein